MVLFRTTTNITRHLNAEAEDRARSRHKDSSSSAASDRKDGNVPTPGSGSDVNEKSKSLIPRWSLGILNDSRTEEVPGTVLLLSSERNEPLGLEAQPPETSHSSMPVQGFRPRTRSSNPKKKTADGKVILEPQPDDSMNDPLNWPAWRRNTSLISIGLYSCCGGGVTPILAAGFNNVAATYNVSFQRVALTTGLYMMGLGIGSVLFCPTAILYGKRPVYLGSAILFVVSTIWCAMAPNYANLVVARIFQGIAVSPVECLPSASIAEIFFLHERAFRIGIYTLLLLGGKNLVPLVSAVIIQALTWRWVFWILAMVAGSGFVLLFLFVPETFWDRTPRPKSKRPSSARRKVSGFFHQPLHMTRSRQASASGPPCTSADLRGVSSNDRDISKEENDQTMQTFQPLSNVEGIRTGEDANLNTTNLPTAAIFKIPSGSHLHNLNSPYYTELEKNADYFEHHVSGQYGERTENDHNGDDYELRNKLEKSDSPVLVSPTRIIRYTTGLRSAPTRTNRELLRPYNGRLSHTKWVRVAVRPFILFAYPSVLWSALVYSLSVGWLIVLSESVSAVYRSRETYNFSALGTGLVYLSPFIGGVLGTAVAGKFSDIIVQYMSRRNDGYYEPEFRLVMAIPVAISTAIGLMGFGWSAQERDRWIVPTVFFGIISFGCSLGSTTAITFCVDSYRHLAGEALVTLNFSKNIFHGLVFSLFFPHWLESDGPKTVFVALGCIQIACLLTTIPMYIFGKRARMWTARKSFMEKF